MASENLIETDILVIGGGIAGCFAAIKSREQGLKVTLVDKGGVGKSGSSRFAHGWWIVYNPEWGHDMNKCLEVTSRRGEYLANRTWTRTILEESWKTYEDLRAWEVEFPVDIDVVRDYEKARLNTEFAQAADPYGRIPLRRDWMLAVRKQVIRAGVKIIDRVMIVDLLKQGERVVGAAGFSIDSSDFFIFKAKATIMAGGNNNFRSPGYHTNSLTGDADAMAYRTGAEITGKEFPDLHFSTANYPAWRGIGGLYAAYWRCTDAEGKDIPARSMDLSLEIAFHEGRGPIYWDLSSTTSEDIKALQEYAWKSHVETQLERAGVDITKHKRHLLFGGSAAGNSDPQTSGIWPVNTDCASNVPGLFAAGDCCCTWYWGALTSGAPWGLSAGAVTGTRAAGGAKKYALQQKNVDVESNVLTQAKRIVYDPLDRRSGFNPRWVTQILQNTVTPYFVLHIKHADRLKAALTLVEFLRDHLVPKLTASDGHELRLAHETRNMTLNAEMILRAALFRTESRGRHYREDFPRRDDPAWLAWIKMKNDNGSMKLFKEPVPKEWWPDLSVPYEVRYLRRFPGE